MELKQSDIDNSLSTVYDIGNSILYEMCKNNFGHTSSGAILAKTILIGRAYAVSLDRGKDKGKSEKEKLEQKLINDDFYQKQVVPIFINSDLDNELLKLKDIKSPRGKENEILTLHNKLQKMLLPINQEEKTSFCSKYLHFHLPDLFFIFDSRAKSVINQFIINEKVNYFTDTNFDSEYSIFYSKARHIQDKIEKDFKRQLTPRQVDNLFLVPANVKLRERVKKKIEKLDE